MPIVVRYNFETNSSSQHSLSTRKDSGWCTDKELARTEETFRCDVNQDAIIVMKESMPATKDDLMDGIWAYNGKLTIWSHYLDFEDSPMQVLRTFEQKARYVIATIFAKKTKGWTKRQAELDAVLGKVLPEITFDYLEALEGHYHGASVNENILYPFLEKYHVTLEEFLTDKRYVVIVNYAEYNKMKWLNMVNEDDIQLEYHPLEATDIPFTLDNGVWRIHEEDLTFGRSPFRVLGTPEGKARYALASHANVNEVINILREVYPDLTDIKVLRDDPDDDDDDRMGYCEDYAMPDDIPLREFILNKKYVIISDGDEYCIWSDFVKSPLFKSDAYDKFDID